MITQLKELITEAVAEGHSKGAQVFLESIVEDSAKQEIFESFEFEEGVASIFEHGCDSDSSEVYYTDDVVEVD